MKSYPVWKLGEIKKLGCGVPATHFSRCNLTEGSPEAEEIRKMLADAKKDLKPPTPPVPVTVNLPDGTTRRQYAFDTPAVPPLPAREKITPGVIHTFAVYRLNLGTVLGMQPRNRTCVAHDVQAKYLKTKVYMRPAKPGHGVKAHPLIQMMCELAGIEDLTADVVGSTNPLNVAHAAMEAFKAQRDPVDIAKMRGKTLIQIDDPGRLPRVLYTPPPSAAPTVPLPGDVRRSVKSWLRAFPRPGDMAALGSAKLAFDKLVSNAWTERGEDGRHFRNKLIHVRGGLAIVKGLDDDISAWFQSQPPRASPMDLQVYTRKSFLDDSFWPGGVHASLDYHATISTAGTTTSASTQQQ
ncbi:hypothetical protein PTSG_02812 [Salpingoeca rosetta]|uniref:Small ribosomal subunit protein uS5 C-terminal domain-containing protein n=1 Tax=Salpingoeca rosetta (strain ATCC 50818 / BSB-021) TaxID=946362 RepID=F2U3E4_SALR5|nr:uncharacterized protein PTSG_02812 [Salpingoeca rosetta]EGD82138.1 hypothetical protein PTSG_02812 [Salpingoeca rosetta]|eukprot:XP_004996321.1 hypothetical protein PTSG_02812 [Salpingoeca rosetta]